MRRIWRWLFLLAVSCGLSASLSAQGGFTTVTGTITGPDSLLWACGTISAQLITAGGAAPTLNGQSFTTVTSPVGLGCPTTASSFATGAFAMRLADSGVIVPSNTTWKFTVNMTPGIAPPAGTGPQSFTYTTAINCSTNTPTTCTSNTIDISTQLSGIAPKLSNSSGSGITPVTVLPPLPCTNGSLVYLSVASASLATGVYVCSNGTWGALPPEANNVYATAFGVTAAGIEDCSATFPTSASPVTVTLSSVTPTASMIGWNMQGSGGCLDAPLYLAVMARCTVTAVNSGAKTVTGSGCATNANGANTATQHLVLAPVEDTPLAAAETAAFSQSTSPCPALILPSNFIYVTTGHFNTYTCNTQATGPQSNGASIYGTGRMNSRLMMSSDFNFATGCPNYNGTPSCFFGHNGVSKQNLGISGGQYPGVNPSGTTCVLQDGIDGATINVFLVGFGSALSNLSAYCVTQNGGPLYFTVDGMGAHGWNILAGGDYGCTYCFFGNNSLQNLVTTAGSGVVLSTNFTGFGPTSTANTYMADWLSCTSGCSWHSTNDAISAITGAGNTAFARCNGGSTCTFIGLTQFPASPANFFTFYTSTGAGHFIIRDSIVGAGSSGDLWLAQSATGIFDDMGNNQFSVTAGQVFNLTAGSVVRTLVPGSTYSNPPTPIVPSCSSTGLTQSACSVLAGGTNEKGTIRVTAGGVGGAFTETLTFVGVFGGSSGSAPACTFMYSNTGSASWTTPALLTISSATTAAVTIAGTATTVNASTYDMTYACVPR